jgi:beta-mannosidase
MAAEARQIIPRRRNHPSLVVWCGGNELMDAPDRPVDDERAPVLAALHAVVRELDPERHWLPTTPSGRRATNTLENIAQDPLGLHDVHGPWEHQGLIEQYALYNQGASLFHSEFGVEGLAHVATLERCLAPENRWPVTRQNPAWSHTSAWWLREETLRSAFGDLPDLASTVAASQFLQAEGLRYAVEADRRRMYHNSGTLPWQFNEPYPNAACTSAVDYFGRPKPAYYAVARAYAPVLVSARFAGQVWPGCSKFEAEVWACNSGAKPLRGAHLTARLVGACGEIYALHRERAALAANSAVRLAAVDWSLAGMHDEVFFLDLNLTDARGTPLSTNRYLFARTGDLAPMLQISLATLQASVVQDDENWRVLLANTGDQTALNVWLAADRGLDSIGYVYFSDNYFCMLPGETRTVQAGWQDIPRGERVIVAQAWNATAPRTCGGEPI